jgi:lipoprotein-releasing system permease protein|tara:strand:+ start:8642 stop:9838 length:1197 start_codon:yes stop_codon:yes gene_type:complete
MRFQLLIARKFMLGGSGSGPSRLNGWISIIGMIIGAFSIIISLSIMNGFEKRVINKLIGFEGDLRITPYSNSDFEQIYSEIAADPLIDEALLYRERIGLIFDKNNSKRIVTFKSINMENLNEFYNIDFINNANDINQKSIAIGYLLAQRLNVDIGDQLSIMSPIDQSTSIGLPVLIDVTVSKIFNSEVLDFDDRIVFISEEIGKKLFLRKQNYDGIDIRLKDRNDLSYLKYDLENKYINFSINTWEDLHKSLINAMKLERLGALAVLCLIILVSSFNLVSTLVLVIIRKIREIGILRALGSTNRDIRKIILFQGALIGGVGIFIGILASLIIILLQNRYGIIPIPSDIYFINQLPMIIYPNDVFVVMFISLIFIIISSFIASRQAIIIGIRDSLQWEK